MSQPDPSLTADSFLRAWSRHEHAPRVVCQKCQFESSEGYPPSHAPGCSQPHELGEFPEDRPVVLNRVDGRLVPSNE